MIRIGHGYDVHRLTDGRKLILGGVEVPFELGLAGHSDADVLIHAIMDSMLGALALGDIGAHFPDTSDKFLNIDSTVLLKEVCRIIDEKGYCIGNIDSTVIAQKPKLKDYIPLMRERIAQVCGVDTDKISVKATTEEKLGFTGSLEGISAHAVALLVKKDN